MQRNRSCPFWYGSTGPVICDGITHQRVTRHDRRKSALSQLRDNRVFVGGRLRQAHRELNLLKFRAHAAYDDGRKSDLTGREAYWIYADAMQKIIVREGGRLLFSGDILSVPIGTVEEIWDMAALIEYPSAAAFARIASSVEVSEIAVHRAAGLAGQLLIRTRSA